MKCTELMTKFMGLQQQSKLRQRDEIRSRAREDIAALEREIAMLGKMVRELRHDRLSETIRKPTKPLSVDQWNKRQERDRKRQKQVNDIQASARKRIADIRAGISQ